MNKPPAEMAQQMVDQCGGRAMALRTAEALTSTNFAMNPTDSKYWQQVAEALRNDQKLKQIADLLGMNVGEP